MQAKRRKGKGKGKGKGGRGRGKGRGKGGGKKGKSKAVDQPEDEIHETQLAQDEKMDMDKVDGSESPRATVSPLPKESMKRMRKARSKRHVLKTAKVQNEAKPKETSKRNAIDRLKSTAYLQEPADTPDASMSSSSPKPVEPAPTPKKSPATAAKSSAKPKRCEAKETPAGTSEPNAKRLKVEEQKKGKDFAAAAQAQILGRIGFYLPLVFFQDFLS